jgi:internalin A
MRQGGLWVGVGFIAHLLVSFILVGCGRAVSGEGGAAGNMNSGGSPAGDAGDGGSPAGDGGNGRSPPGGGTDGRSLGGQASAGSPAAGAGASSAAGTPTEAGAGGKGGAEPCAGPLVFADPDIEVTVREAIGKPAGDIFSQDVASLDDVPGFFSVFPIDCSPVACVRPQKPGLDRWITSLSGVECLPLHKFEADTWGVVDFSPLGALPQLTSLNLGSAPDLSQLVPLPELSELRLWSTPGDLSGLKNFPGLRVFVAESVQRKLGATGLAPVAQLKNLRELVVHDGHISGVSALVGLSELTRVDLSNNDIVDISPLLGNPGIDAGDELVLNENPINCVQDAIAGLRARGVSVSVDCL